MEEVILLLVLLFTQTIEISSLPNVADTSQNCSGPHQYIREGTTLCCSRCPPGHKLKEECTERHDTVCEPCGPEQYMEKWNFAKNCFSCIRCKKTKGLQFKQTCSPTTNAKCGCMPDRFCYMGNDKGCQDCFSYKTCKKGFGVSVPGTDISDVKCQKCQEGTFSDTVSSTDACKPHSTCDKRDIISKGNATSDTACKSLASTQPNVIFNAKPETTVNSTAASQLRTTTHYNSKSLPMHTTNTTVPGILLISKTQMPNKTKSQKPESGFDKQTAAVTGIVAGIILLIAVIVALVLRKRVFPKSALEDNTKVDANGNCEMHNDKTNLCYLGNTHRLSVNTDQPEQQCLLQNGTVAQTQYTSNTFDHNKSESIESTLPLHAPESALSEPMPLQSNVDQFVSQKASNVQNSSQPTSPQNMTPSPLVNVNINLHIGNGACGTPAVMLKDMTPAEPQIPFGEEEESCSLLQQEEGKPSLLSVEESGRFNNILLTEQFV